MNSDEPKNEAEFLQRQSQSARDALARLRGEVVDSLGRTTDVGAWTARYPWPALGAAAATGIATGWAMGRMTRSPSRRTQAEADASAATAAAAAQHAASAANQAQAAAAQVHPTSRLLAGLGTLVGVVAAAAATSAAQAVGQVVKDTVRDSLRSEDPS